jgi:type 1 fimbria pilin
MIVNKKPVAHLMALALAATCWGAVASTANVTMTGEVTSATCTLTQASESVAVDLGRPSVADFADRAAGYAASTAGFNLDLTNCSGISELAVWASGAQLEQGLTNAIANTATSGATGVAMQIFHNSALNTAMDPNTDYSNSLTLGVADSANHRLSFTAKMVKVAADQEVTAGPVRGNVTLNVAYP